MRKKEIFVSLVTLGCNKNQTDSEFLLKGLAEYYNVTTDLNKSDVIILNTCAFLEEARNEAKSYILDLSKYKSKKLKCLVMTGCYAEFLNKNNQFENIFNKVDLVLGLLDIKSFCHAINLFLENKKKTYYFSQENNIFGLFNENANRIVSHPNYAYLKISEGCNNRCSYCLIPYIKGNFKSRKKETIFKEANELLKNNIKEINIVSQDIGQYGLDLYENYNLIDLLKTITKENKNDFWIRLLYLHPKYINNDLINFIKDSKSILNYIDLPIQHINDKILKLMNRHITKNEILKKLDLLKENIPDICIRTTFIVGFPSETEEDFKEIISLIEQKYFDRVGVFTFSREQNTPSYNLENQVEENIKNIRKNEIMQLMQKISLEKNKEFLNKTFNFLPEKIENDSIVGRIFSMAPEVDGNVYIKNFNKNLLEKNFNKFWDVKLIKCDEYDFIGEIIN